MMQPDTGFITTPLHSDDAKLMKMIQQNNHHAFTLLVDRHHKRFYGVAYRMILNKEEAEDIVQEGFLKIWNKPDMWDAGTNAKFTTWFYRIIINLCYDYHRKNRHVTINEELYEAIPSNENIAEFYEQQQQQRMLRSALKSLPDRQRIALILCFYEGLSNQEAADIMGLKLKALQSLVMRAKLHLKDTLAPYVSEKKSINTAGHRP